MRHSDIIDGLGGADIVAPRIGRHPSTVRKWRLSGIPASRWMEVVALGERLTLEALAAGCGAKGEPMKRGRKPGKAINHDGGPRGKRTVLGAGGAR